MSDAARHRLPGDRPSEEELARMLRVDHAGEYGATRIYEGQLDVLGRGRAAGVIRQMAEAEKRHLARFETLLQERRVRPTLLHPLWTCCRLCARRRDRAARRAGCDGMHGRGRGSHRRALPGSGRNDSVRTIRPFGRRSCRFATTRSHIATSRSRKGRRRARPMT